MTFIDTSALYAVLDRDDDHHEAARATWERLLRSSATLFTHNYVLIETSALAQHRLGLPALGAIEEVLIPVLRVQWITQAHHSTAVAMVLTAQRKKLSIVDCASFLIMREQGISEAFTFDKHFAEQGFGIVPSARNRD